MSNAILHIICGNCGCNSLFTYRIDPAGKDIDGQLHPEVFISCGNCSTLHNLSEIMLEVEPT